MLAPDTGCVGRTQEGFSWASEVTPIKPIMVRISSSSNSSMRAIPASPGAARASPCSFPTPTALSGEYRPLRRGGASRHAQVRSRASFDHLVGAHEY